MGFCSLFLLRRHIQRAAVIIRPSTLLKFHQLLKQRKYRLLYSSSGNRKPGPKGPSKELIAAIVDMKRRNPTFGCPRIAQQINFAFGIAIDKDVVKRVVAAHYPCDSGGDGPSWLTFLGHTKDSLWSVDLFRCESILLRNHWVLVVMDQFARRLVCFGVHAANSMMPLHSWSQSHRKKCATLATECTGAYCPSLIPGLMSHPCISGHLPD